MEAETGRKKGICLFIYVFVYVSICVRGELHPRQREHHVQRTLSQGKQRGTFKELHNGFSDIEFELEHGVA